MPQPEKSSKAAVGRRPTKDEIRELHLAYATFRKAAPWEVLPNDRPLVIHHVANRRTGYLAVSEPATSYYHGRNGLRAYLDAAPGIIGYHDCITVFQRPADAIHPDELETLRGLRLGIPHRGPYPLFRSHIPFHMEWPPNAPQSQLMAEALNQAAACAEYLRQNPQPAQPADPELPAHAPVWTIRQDERTLTWLPLPSYDQTEPGHQILDRQLLDEARQLPRTEETWQMSNLCPPIALFEKARQAARPHYPVIATTVTDNDPPEHLSMVDFSRHDTARQQSVVLQTMISLGRRPSHIQTFLPVQQDAISPIAAELDFTTSRNADMPFHPQDVIPILEALSGQSQGTQRRSGSPTRPEEPKQPLVRTGGRFPELPDTDTLAHAHLMAAEFPGLTHNPNREVAPPVTLAEPRRLTTAMTIPQALKRIAEVDGGAIDLKAAAETIISAGVARSRNRQAVARAIARHIDHDAEWQRIDHNTARNQTAAQVSPDNIPLPASTPSTPPTADAQRPASPISAAQYLELLTKR